LVTNLLYLQGKWDPFLNDAQIEFSLKCANVSVWFLQFINGMNNSRGLLALS